MDSPRTARISITVFFFLSGFGYATWASRIADLQHRLNLNEAQLGSTLFALPLGLILTLPVTGYLLQRFSSRSIMMVGALAFNVMLGCLGFVTQTWQLVLVLFCFGSSRNLLNISINAQAVAIQALYTRSIITTFHGVWSLAGAAGSGLGWLMVYLNILPDWHFLVVGIFLVIAGTLAYPTSLHQKPAPQGNARKFILPDRHLLKFGLISFAVMACEGTMIDWTIVYFNKAVRAPESIINAGYVAYMAAMAAGRFAGDKVVHKLGIATMIKYSGLLVFCGLMLSALLPYTITAGLGFMMTGVGVSCVVPLVFSMAGKTKSMSSSSAVAAISTVGYMGFLIVPPVVGYIAQVAGLRWAFGLMAGFGLLIVNMILRAQKEEHNHI
ncbi:MFS transporter [Chitinophaga tropicalis]|uniref:MFS transporter n=1 Tax=Chitinophaga tropicalis TaxID=2683588 RepID=A0A7K1U2D1_9BACT|nr:MFS transporter [Chitinophaga tropicalis]MVT08517.1 MFS transporter [Chitinophaga tropicalis]